MAEWGGKTCWHARSAPFSPTLNGYFFQEDFDNDVDALLEEGMPMPKKMRLAEDNAEDSDHLSDGEGGVQPMMTKIKTVLKSEWWISGGELTCF